MSDSDELRLTVNEAIYNIDMAARELAQVARCLVIAHLAAQKGDTLKEVSEISEVSTRLRRVEEHCGTLSKLAGYGDADR